ncbi:Outer-membrane lipoprotein carrier protein [Zhongshania aliphaticivorans]|uniref:Outer-membrane lipoprotein carrier protein n=1 Tax=Zhongshania aliphaticivorans TaxID=1470434 RepID=A0A5S9NWY9_9GAMM|nr:outer membrane lipoprotein chaperone LolA [Zhongshania aliphaticivorans]CAA0088807.1 Outer-membrane lipoprotein carrier protein [Zhongshania aliphaticivorans]CAA0095183.1 Outer-membrane lipoprotein carrier protein [Zhongshania aliphaticivorans]
MRQLFVFLCLSLLQLPVFAEGDVAQLHLHLSGAQSLSANFVQQVRDTDGNLLQESKGTIALKRPNNIRWESLEPFRYLLVSNGQTVWRYDADLEQLNTEEFNSLMSQTPAMIIGASIDELAADYSVTVVKSDNSREFILIPKQQGAFLEMRLLFSMGKFTGMRLVDTLEQTTQIDFIKPKYNIEFDEKTFEFNQENEAAAR